MSTGAISTTETVFACNLNAIAADELEQHKSRVQAVFSAVEETKEFPNGYAFRLPTNSDTLLNAAAFIANERLCCPFFEFSIAVTANGGPIWLQLAGTADVKEFLKAEFSQVIDLTAK